MHTFPSRILLRNAGNHRRVVNRKKKLHFFHHFFFTSFWRLDFFFTTLSHWISVRWIDLWPTLLNFPTVGMNYNAVDKKKRENFTGLKKIYFFKPFYSNVEHSIKLSNQSESNNYIDANIKWVSYRFEFQIAVDWH